MTNNIFSNTYMNGLAQFQEAQIEFETRLRMSRAGYPLDGFSQVSPPPGSVIISDTFTPSPFSDEETHGEIVAKATRSIGFKEHILVQREALSSPHLNDIFTSEQAFFLPMQPEEARENVRRFALSNALAFLEEETASVNSAYKSKATNSALNLSQGASIASLAGRIYATAKNAWQPHTAVQATTCQDATIVAKNLASGFGLSFEKLISQDKKTAGRERAKLQQALVDTVGLAIRNDKEVKAAKANFEAAVKRFELEENSVVIAAGNEGTKLKMMQEDAYGYALKHAPQDFTTNLLDTPEATMVGATEKSCQNSNSLEHIADYTSINKGVDIYASGDVLAPKEQSGKHVGTSFAAPRVAAVMATLHKRYPKLSSAQIETLVKQSLTSQLKNGNERYLSIDENKYYQLMNSEKY